MKAINKPLPNRILDKRLEDCCINETSTYRINSDIIIVVPKEMLKSISGQEFICQLRNPKIYFKANVPHIASINNQKKNILKLYKHGTNVFGFSFKCKNDKYDASFGIRVAKERLLQKCEDTSRV